MIRCDSSRMSANARATSSASSSPLRRSSAFGLGSTATYVGFSANDNAYYLGYYQKLGTQQGKTGTALTAFVNSAMETLILSNTASYNDLANKFGVGGTYASRTQGYDP